jgi:peptidoglycan-associated lipoprotein
LTSEQTNYMKGIGIKTMRNRSMLLFATTFIFAALVLFGCTQKAAVKDDTTTGEKKVAAQSDAKAKEEVTKKEAKAGVQEFSKVYFAYNSAKIRKGDKAALDKNAKWLKANNAAKITIEGYCDERGTAEYNLALGERRAKSAAKYLVSKGISAKNIKTVSFGEDKPVDPGHNETAWAKNRRAEFVLND